MKFFKNVKDSNKLMLASTLCNITSSSIKSSVQLTNISPSSCLLPNFSLPPSHSSLCHNALLPLPPNHQSHLYPYFLLNIQLATPMSQFLFTHKLVTLHLSIFFLTFISFFLLFFQIFCQLCLSHSFIILLTTHIVKFNKDILF